MVLAADTHVHAYPHFDLGRLFRESLRSLGRLEAGAVSAIFLTERHDCHVFAELSHRASAAPELMKVEAGTEPGALWVTMAPDQRLLVIAGRQIVTAERLEVLCLTADAEVRDGLPIRAALAATREAGGIPVIPWSPGKWTGSRARLIRHLLDDSGVAPFLLADSSLRPRGWPRPAAFRHAERRGIGILAGSDPLPLPGQEARAGTYGIVTGDDFDVDSPITSLRRMFDAEAGTWRVAGTRRGGVEVLRDLAALQREKTAEAKP